MNPILKRNIEIKMAKGKESVSPSKSTNYQLYIIIVINYENICHPEDICDG